MAELPPQLSGGFLPPTLPSPSPSHNSTASTVSNLPHPRSNPLRAGSAKEDAARRYVEARLLVVSRRYAKKFQPMEEGDDVKGYVEFGEVARDLGGVVDVVWLSGTRMSRIISFPLPFCFQIKKSIRSYTLREKLIRNVISSESSNPLSSKHSTLRNNLPLRLPLLTHRHILPPPQTRPCVLFSLERGR